MADVSASQGTQAFASTLTDLMTSLAVIFILLLVVFLKQSHDQSRKAKEQVKSKLTELLEQKSLDLRQDPEDPLKLSVMVGEDQLRFPVNGFSLSPAASEFVTTFFKTFAGKICDPTLRDKVDSVVIEGHTDTSGERTPEGVGHNIALSQRRSFSVLESALKSVQGDPQLYECLLKLTSANGRGSRSPIMVSGAYNPDLSRRVEVKIRVRSSEQQFKAAAEQALQSSGIPPAIAPGAAVAPSGPGAVGPAAPPVAAPVSAAPPAGR
jgi:outer membrane protein OmpA-like peptidoglycan-associated protein